MIAAAFPKRKLLLFALLSVADLALTRRLLGAEDSAAYESNPVAAWWLARFGWVGLTGFKAATVLTAAGLVAVICRRRPRAGHRVLAFACAAVAAVVAYSGYLCDTTRRQTAGLDPAESAALLAEAGRVDEARRRVRGYAEARDVILEDLRARRCGLEEGVSRLAATGQGRDPAFLRGAGARHPGYSAAEYLAISLISHIEAGAAESGADAHLTADLVAEFQAVYGRTAPSWLTDRAGRGGGTMLLH
jgi:hypothetical protein